MPAIPYLFESSPAKGLISVTPADGSTLQWATPIRGFICTAGGVVNVVALDGSTALVPVAANTVYQIAALRIQATSTTATGIVGLV